MSRPRAMIEEEAIGWIIRMRDPAFDAWEGFTGWLEADPSHLQIYDEMALADFDIAAAVKDIPPPVKLAANDDEPESTGTARRRVIGWGLAASLLVTIGYTSLQTGASTYSVATASDGRQTVRLADGSRIDLNGSTRLVLDRKNPRFARLERGEALFTVIHNTDNPFIVEAAGATLMDAGTAFNVVHDGGRMEVAVAEGLVIYNPKAERIALPAGRMLRASDAGQVKVGATDKASVASWQQGRLVYNGELLSSVAADLSRNLGVEVRAGRAAAAQSFSGVIQLDGADDAVIERAGNLMGVEVRRSGKGWVLAAEGDAAR